MKNISFMNEKYIRTKFQKQGNAIGFKIDQVKLVNGHTANREYLDHPGAVAVLAFPRPGHLILVRQFRYAVKSVTWEIPAGKLDKNERPDRCVRRELEEETGYKAGRIRKLMTFWPTASFANEVIHIYIADRLKKGIPKPDEDEFLSCHIIPLTKLYRWIDEGRIKDAKTLIGVLAHRTRRG